MNVKVADTEKKRHGLEHFLKAAPDGSSAGETVHIEILSQLGHLIVRGDSQDLRFLEAARGVLGQELPVTPNTATVSQHRVYWLGPDEWLILGSASDTQMLGEKLKDAFSGINAAVNNVSGGQLVLRVTGHNVVEVLAKGCTLDFHQQTFTAGMCAQSGLAKANVLIGLVDRDELRSTFDIVVRRSFADYLLRWLEHAAEEFGVRISSS